MQAVRSFSCVIVNVGAQTLDSHTRASHRLLTRAGGNQCIEPPDTSRCCFVLHCTTVSRRWAFVRLKHNSVGGNRQEFGCTTTWDMRKRPLAPLPRVVRPRPSSYAGMGGLHRRPFLKLAARGGMYFLESNVMLSTCATNRTAPGVHRRGFCIALCHQLLPLLPVVGVAGVLQRLQALLLSHAPHR